VGLGPGLVAGILCALAVGLKYKLGFDDSLDVVGVHFVGGWIGCLWIGFFATTGADAVGSNAADAEAFTYVVREGLFYGGGADQLIAQAEGAGIVTVWSFTVALVIGFILKAVGLFRAKPEAEVDGIDIHEHKESAYDFSDPGSGSSGGAFALAGIGTSTAAPTAESKPSQPANV
jgi:Amt family ammonium transporter